MEGGIKLGIVEAGDVVVHRGNGGLELARKMKAEGLGDIAYDRKEKGRRDDLAAGTGIEMVNKAAETEAR